MLESKTIRVWFCATLLLCATYCGGVSKAQEKPLKFPADYHIAPGDLVRIDVWKEPEISRTIPVWPDGKIYLPLLNDVQAAGLTAMQLADAIQQGLTKYITNPQVTVTVTETPSHPPKAIPPRPPVSPDLKQKCCVA